MADMRNRGDLQLKVLWLVIGLTYIVYTIYVTLTPHPPVPFKTFLFDKAYHFLGYLCMMGWFGLIYQALRPRVLLALTFILLGIVLEFLQGMGGVRQFEVADMLANGLGVLAAWLVVLSPLRLTLYWFEQRVLHLSR